MANNTLDFILLEISRAMLPLEIGLSSTEQTALLVNSLGWELPPGVDELGLTAIDVSGLTDKLKAVQSATLEEQGDTLLMAARYADLLVALGEVIRDIRAVAAAIHTLPGVSSDYLTKTRIHERLVNRLMDKLLIEYVEQYHYKLFSFLTFAGIFERRACDANSDIYRVQYVDNKIKFGRAILLFSDPAALMEDTYKWGTDDFKSDWLLALFATLLQSLGGQVLLRKLPRKVEEKILGHPVPEAEADPAPQVVITLLKGLGWDSMEVGLAAFGLRPSTQGGEDGGIGVFPFAHGTAELVFPISPDWSLNIDSSLDVQGGIVFLLRPGQPVQVQIDLFNPEGSNVAATGKVLIKLCCGTANCDSIQLLTIPGGLSLQAQQIHIGAGAGLVTGNLFDALAEVGVTGGQLVLAAPQGDSFIGRLLPSEGAHVDFDLTIGWSRDQGLYFQGSATLELRLPVHFSIGPVDFHDVYLAITPGEDKGLAAEASATFTGEFGPVTASIDRLGLTAELSVPEDRDGSLGPLDLALNVKSPTGAGLAVDAAGITGGGVLKFDDANQRYAGDLTLNFGEIGLTAIGLITTKMPDGSEGFALLINIGTTFNPPMQLSMGFNLSGVGGLIGVNRSIEIDALRTGLKNRTLDSILFPDPSTVIANASKIISDLRTVFPPAEESYVVGPMVKIGWGSPTIITADLGIFLEFPDPVRIVLLGQVEAALPEEKKALVVIHLDVLGVLDFAKEELTFQASLYDSRILSFTLFGDSAFLLGWGCDPRFALSLGGFHPKFSPPPPAIVFADLKRLTLDIGTGSKLQLACRAYLALTPNSLQFGARVDLYASAGGFTAEGHLGFDALLYLSPFSFEVEICGGVHLKYKGLSLCGINLTLLLSGPTPWHARGKAKISLLFFSIKVGFSITWGESEKVTLAPIDAWQPLQDALAAAGNWSSGLPAGRTLVESLRGFEEDAPGMIIVHPAGRLEVRQNVVPLGICLDKAGNAPITGHDRFDIKDLIVDVEDLIVEGKSLNPEPVQEFFARGQFEELTSDQKLSVPSFERMKGGVTTAASEMVRIDGVDDVVEYTPVTYESIHIKRDSTSELQQLDGEFEWEEAQFIAAAGITRKAIRRAGPRKRFSALRPRPKVGVHEDAYCIANAEDLTRATLSSELDHENRNMTRMAADQVLRAQIELEPEQADNLLVVPEYEVYEVIA